MTNNIIKFLIIITIFLQSKATAIAWYEHAELTTVQSQVYSFPQHDNPEEISANMANVVTYHPYHPRAEGLENTYNCIGIGMNTNFFGMAIDLSPLLPPAIQQAIQGEGLEIEYHFVSQKISRENEQEPLLLRPHYCLFPEAERESTNLALATTHAMIYRCVFNGDEIEYNAIDIGANTGISLHPMGGEAEIGVLNPNTTIASPDNMSIGAKNLENTFFWSIVRRDNRVVVTLIHLINARPNGGDLVLSAQYREFLQNIAYI